MEDQPTYKDHHPDPNRWWTHRRKQAYISLAWVILQTFLWIGVGVYSLPLLSSLAVVIGWSYGIPLTVLIAYYGGSSFDDYIGKKKLD